MKMSISDIKRIVREELDAVGIGSTQGQMGVKSAKKKDEECGCYECGETGDSDGEKAFSYEILISGDDPMEGS